MKLAPKNSQQNFLSSTQVNLRTKMKYEQPID